MPTPKEHSHDYLSRCAPHRGRAPAGKSIASVREALAGLKYGNVSLTVHEGRVVQIDVTEKKRLKPN
jgi:hypothetical protein